VLVTGGIAEGKIKRVVGMASAVLFDNNDPLNAANRRIAIIVLSKEAEESLNKVSGGLAVGGGDEAPKENADVAPR
jgi:chemotaxis protein MotB